MRDNGSNEVVYCIDVCGMRDNGCRSALMWDNCRNESVRALMCVERGIMRAYTCIDVCGTVVVYLCGMTIIPHSTHVS